jgi:hypothetical protein
MIGFLVKIVDWVFICDVDPFPFGGGVTTLEALSVCTPVITVPTAQTVPALTAGMILTMMQSNQTIQASSEDRHLENNSNNEGGSLLGQLIASTREEMAATVIRLLKSDLKSRQAAFTNPQAPHTNELLSLRSALCERSSLVFEQRESVNEWAEFLRRAAM